VWFIAAAIALFCAYLTGNRLAHPFIDGDLFWQRRLGEYVLAHHAIPSALGADTFTAAGAPWVAQEWLLGVVAALAFGHKAVWALSLFAGTAVFVALLLTAFRAKRAGASMYSTLAALLFAGICLEGPFAIRAQVLAWPLLAALLLALDGEDIAVLWTVPVTIAWANLHASVMLAVPIVWLDTIVHAVTHGVHDRGTRTRMLASFLVPVATLATPLGTKLPVYAVALLNSPIRQYIAEWQPLTGVNTQVIAGLLPLVAIVVYGARTLWRQRPRDLVLAAIMAVLTLLSVRSIALFAIVAAVPASLVVAAGETWSNPLSSRKYAATIALVTILLIPVTGWIAFRAHPMIQPWEAPRTSIDALAHMPGAHRLFCAEFSWCALALGDPNVKVFLDGRADPYPLPVWQAFATIAALQPGWLETLDRYRVNALVVASSDPLADALRNTAGWRLTPQLDSCCVLFVRR
jgi:hypothetical protein